MDLKIAKINRML